jgi:glyoxylase I family protein
VERVTGIGGVFFRAGDPQALSLWYAEHLGVSQPPASYDERVWEQQAGPTVFAPFPADSDYFRRSDRQWAVNFRVRDLDAMVDSCVGPASWWTSTRRPIRTVDSPS